MPSSSSIAGFDNRLALAIRRCLGISLSGALLTLPVAALAQSETSAEESMDTMVVVGTALKVEAPTLETPRSTSLVTSEALEKRAVTKLDEAFQYRSGVVSPYGSDNNNDWFFLRGFSAEDSTYQDGLRLFREGGYFWWMTEPFGLQEVRLLKGPASILYGEAPPGGVINAISKRPTEEPRGLFEVEVGNRNHRQVGIDVSGPINDDVRYRMVGLFSERDGELDGTYNERYYFAPSLEVDLSEDTNITFLASFQKDDGVPTTGFFLPYGSLYDTPFGRVDPSTNLGEPGYDTNERRQLSLGYEFEHYFNDTWSFEQNFRYSELELNLRSAYVSSLGYADPQDPDNWINDGRSASRGIIYRDGEYDTYTVDNRFIGKWYSESFENTFLVGIDYQKFDLSYANGDDFSFGEPIDIFDPAYGNFTPVSESDLVYHDEDKEQVGVYIQDQLRLNNRWVLLAGLRHDSVDSTVKSTASDTASQGYDEEQLSFSGGIMYLGDYGISPYLSYSESFSPIVGTGPDGDQYVPTEGEQWELGAKYAPAWLDGYVTAAVFDLKETNTLYLRDGEVKQRQGGERHSRGFELEGIGYLTDQLRLTAAYAYTDTTIENPVDGEFRAGLIPRHQVSLWLDYSFEDGVLNGLAVGGGTRYVGGSIDGDKSIPSYTLYDAMVGYDFADGWRAQVNVNNLTDEEYISGCNYWCYYGESRSVIGSLSYRW